MKPSSPLGAAVIFIATLATRAAESPVAPDIWALRYHAENLDPAGDTDGDGYSNDDERQAGTSPLDGTSRPGLAIAEMTATKVYLDVTSQPEKAYQLYTAASPAGPWNKHGKKTRADGPILRLSGPRQESTGFFRVEVSDDDSDRDGLSDWDELQLAGFDSKDDDSFSTGIRDGDRDVATAMLAALQSGRIRLEAPTPVTYESDRQPAIVTISREPDATLPPGFPFTLFVRTGGTGDPSKSAATAADGTLTDTAGLPLPGRLVLPDASSTVTLHITPVADDLREVPEEFRVAVSGCPTAATVTIRDAPPTPSNELLLLARLRPVLGSASPGSGIATLRIPGDNDIANLSLSFSNLRSPVRDIWIESSNDTPMHPLSLVEQAGQDWPIRSGGAYPTDQAVLDALCSAEICLSVRSDAFPSGEIEGPFIEAYGTVGFTPPPPPPPVEPLTGDELDRDIVRFLTQATFGPTMAEVENLRERVSLHSGDRIAAFGEWIDEQFALPSPSLLAYAMAADRQEIEVRAALPPEHPEFNPAYEPDLFNRIRGWWLLARHAPDQLRQRTAFGLSEIFVISDQDLEIHWRPYGTASYYDMLRTGASGSYRSLLGQVARHPIMGQYLSHLRSGKAVLSEDGEVISSPDENFAREIMQLFSIGLVELHPDGSLKVDGSGLPIPTYDQDDVTEMARVFTGWSFSVVNSPPESNQVVPNTGFFQGNGLTRRESQWIEPMKVFEAYHDTDAKHPLGLALPAGQTGEQDLDAVLDHLATHPNTAPFICRRLIQRLVTANPSQGYLYRVASTFTESGGDLAATVRAILLDPEARSPGAGFSHAGSGKKKEPIVAHLAFLRAFGVKSGLYLSDLEAFGYPAEELAKFPEGTTRLRYWPTHFSLGQSPQSAPSVFNWFPPDHIPAGALAANGLTSPELKLANENSVFQEINLLHTLIFGSLYTTPVPAQGTAPYSYPGTANYVKFDPAPLEARYLASVDTSGDGQFNSLDTTFGQPAAITAACEAVVDHIDLLLCAGSLKARYADTPGLPRRTIVEAVAAIQSGNNNYNHAGVQAACMRDRIRNALWLVVSSPDAAIQK